MPTGGKLRIGFVTWNVSTHTARRRKGDEMNDSKKVMAIKCQTCGAHKPAFGEGCSECYGLSHQFPVPLQTGENGADVWTDSGGESRLIAEVCENYPDSTPEERANSEFIVRACNAHEKLVEALEAACKWAMTMQYGSAPWLDDAENLVIRCGGRAVIKAIEADGYIVKGAK